METRLSRVLGLKRIEQDNKFIEQRYFRIIGYNQAINDLDQLSPDVHKLREIINSRKTWDATPKAYTNKMPFFEEDTDLAQEIINKMNLWLVRRANEKN